jgi:hypothetical protein
MKTITNRIGNPLQVAIRYLALVAAIGSWLVAGTALAAPANDNFADAINLPGSSGTQTGTDNIDATSEVGEPALAGDITKTVWFKWTSPGNGDFTVGTLGSRNAVPAEFDTVLGIYTGSSLNALTPLGATPKDTVLEESMTLPVTTGTTYYIQIGGYLNETATNLVLNWSFAARVFDAGILTFGPGATVGPVVSNAAQISWTVLNGTDLTALPATFTLSPNATCDRISGATQDFTAPVVYRVTSFDGLVVNDYTVTVAFPPPWVAPPMPPVTAGMMVWLTADGVDPADVNQLDGTGRVQLWNDLSGNNFHASNDTESQRPSYIPSGMNGKPALRFTEASSSKLFLGDLSASFAIVPPVDSSPIATNIGSGGAALDGAYLNIPTRGVAGALIGDSDSATTLNGTNQNVQIPWSAAMNPATAGISDPFTVEAWVKPNGAPAGSRIIMQSMRQPGRLGTPNDIPNDRTGWFLRYIGNDLQFAVGTATGAPFYYYYTVPGVASANNWQHTAVVYDGDETPTIYVNGVAQTYVLTRQDGLAFNPGEAESIRVQVNTDCPALIGDRAFGGWAFNGVIDEVAFYASALSEARIQAHYANAINTPPRPRPYDAEIALDNPVAHYKLNEPASPVVLSGATVFAVAAPNNDARYNLFGNRANDDRWVANTWTESSPGSFRGGRAAFGATGFAQWPATGAHVYSLASSATQYGFVINGNPNPALSTTGDYNSGAGANWTIGDSAANNDQRFNGDIAEMIVFNRVLTPLEAQQVGGYLAQKYGLNTNYPPLNLTAKLTSPANAVAYPDNAPILATSTVTAGSLDGSKAPYSVEFWLNGTLKGTATTAPYSVDLGVLPLGPHQVYAKVIDGSTTPVIATSMTHSFTVVPAITTTTTIASSANPSTFGSGLVTATVVAANSSALTGGTVQFFDVGAPLGAPVPVNTATGQATYNISLLGAGTREITATYSGFDGRSASTSPVLSQVVEKAPLTVTATSVFRPTATSNLDPLPYKIAGYVNGHTLATSGVTGQPLLTTPAGPAAPVGTYTITCDLGTLAADNYSFTLVNGTLTVANVPDTFSINFFVGPEWPFGGLGEFGNEAAKEALKIEPGMPAGLGDWFTNGWLNYLVPWAPTAARPPVTLTSNRGSSATFTFIDCRNGWTHTGTARTTLVGDGNGNMMDAHVNSTLEGADNTFKMEMKDIPFDSYDVIFYLGANLAQFGDGKGAIVFNGAAERDFTLKPGAFDGTFTEMVDATTPGNYIVYRGVTGSSFTAQTYGKGPNGFNHIGPFGFQIRSAVTDYDTWAQGFPDADLDNPNADLDGDGWTNDEERLFGLNPTDGSSVNPITVPLDSAAGTFSFTRRNTALTGKFTDIETSTDLQLWTVDVGAELVVGETAANGVQRVDVTLSEGLLTAPKLFVRVSQRDARTPLSENFEAGNGGFTVLTTKGSDWAWGAPNSAGLGGSVTEGNGGSINCWGTNIGNPGIYINPTDTCLRSVEVDLTNVAAAQLTFAEALDISPDDTAVVNILDSTTNAVIASAIYTAKDPNESLAKWAVANGGNPIPIPAAAIGRKVRIEWCLSGITPEYFGWYIDDVTVQEVAP